MKAFLLLSVLPALGVAKADVRITPADGRRLAQAAFAESRDPRYTLTLAPGPDAFQIANGRVTMVATVTLHLGMDIACPVRISGRPVIRGKWVGLDAPGIDSDDWTCRTAGAALERFALSSLQAGGWDLSSILVRASWDPTQPGPRIPGVQCLTPAEITLRSVTLEPQAMVVQVELPDSAVRQKCPD
ncbi:MAG TPA: hypothetical protein VMG41_12225 [Gemmatimonadales bacterium]|nr:hypothetical protein [Gemmatimonadales bacterium]